MANGTGFGYRYHMWPPPPRRPDRKKVSGSPESAGRSGASENGDIRLYRLWCGVRSGKKERNNDHNEISRGYFCSGRTSFGPLNNTSVRLWNFYLWPLYGVSVNFSRRYLVGCNEMRVCAKAGKVFIFGY